MIRFDPPLEIPTDGLTPDWPRVTLACWDLATRCWFRSEYRRIRAVLNTYETRLVINARVMYMHALSDRGRAVARLHLLSAAVS